MDYETLDVSEKDGVAKIVLNRPDKMNALTTQMRAEIEHAVKTSGLSARVVMITGAGRAFCSGQDLGDRANAASIDLERTLRDEYQPMLDAIINCPVPTIAAVNGAAAGIASESAYFLQAFARIGLIPDAGGTYVMPRAMGMAKAMGAALFADKISAKQADAWGLIWEAVPDEQFAEHVASARVGTMMSRRNWLWRRASRALAGKAGISRKACWPSLKSARRVLRGVKRFDDIAIEKGRSIERPFLLDLFGG